MKLSKLTVTQKELLADIVEAGSLRISVGRKPIARLIDLGLVRAEASSDPYFPNIIATEAGRQVHNDRRTTPFLPDHLSVDEFNTLNHIRNYLDIEGEAETYPKCYRVAARLVKYGLAEWGQKSGHTSFEILPTAAGRELLSKVVR